MRLQGPNVAITADRSQPPTGDQLVVPPGNMVGRFFPSVFISVYSRFPIELHRFQKVRHHQLRRRAARSPCPTLLASAVAARFAG
jgi:hypothetical protein